MENCWWNEKQEISKTSAEEWGVSRRSVQEIYKKFLNTTSVADRYRSGRPAKTTLRERRHLIIMSKKKPFQSSTILQNSGLVEKQSLIQHSNESYDNMVCMDEKLF